MTVYIYIYLYDTTIVNCLDSMGGTHSIECNSAAKDIWQFCIEREICISAALIPGENNTQAGSESIEFLLIIRGGMAEARHISTSYKNLVESPLDPFVSKLNAQVSCYASWRPNPDPFQLHGKQFFYTFLLFSLISYCLHKIVKVEAEGIMTVSLWPTQPCVDVTLDSRCAKDTSTATEHAPNARERA